MQWIDRNVQKPMTYTSINNGDGTITLTPAPGTVYAAGTPITASNMNIIDNLKCDCVESTTQFPTYTSGDITKIEHKLTVSPYTTIRTDNFTYTPTQITEVRTLNTGETITLQYNFDASGNYTGTVVT